MNSKKIEDLSREQLISLVNMQKALIFQLRQAGISSRMELDKREYYLALNYEKGWKDAVKKIANFIDRHCREYE